MRIRLILLLVVAAGLVTIFARPTRSSAPSHNFGSIHNAPPVTENWEAPV